ncbi:MAG: DUF3299 domain-containing protein [Bdellovibrionaceae bacterium]|nr:DUF3299 domain-containing protein [Pseudobdellovibrionaceae bacterium]MBX3033130.1 DUF3299 domain-containing protein [Pseudobdellovibrionaceae bacterium]
MQKLVLIGAIILAGVLGTVVYLRIAHQAPMDGVEVTWEMLGQLDYITGKAGSELEALDGHGVKIPGFMVPLEDSQQSVTEFLLVPTPQACIHVPPPPPNQMVYITMKEGTAVAFGPIWVHGRLKITPKKHMYGEASFEVEGVSVEPYR